MELASVTESVAVIRADAVGPISQSEAMRELKASPWESRTRCERRLEALRREAPVGDMLVALKGVAPSGLEEIGPSNRKESTGEEDFKSKRHFEAKKCGPSGHRHLPQHVYGYKNFTSR